jgi:regulator of nonsense transcripts 1
MSEPHEKVHFHTEEEDEEDDDEEEEEEEEEDDDEEEEEDESDEEEEDDESGEDFSDVSEEEGDPAQFQYTRINHYDEDALPEYACRYCGIHNPCSVAKCVETNKWFCNGTNSHLIHHLVRSRSHQVQLHPESPLGDTVLECYNCGSKNSFVLGFVPASASSVVVLLCRVCVETVPGLKDMDWELSQWHPLIQDRQFLNWLIKTPSDEELLAAREITITDMGKLEELWKTNPLARYADVQKSNKTNADSENDGIECQPVLRRYEDGFHYQNILAPLVKMEADYDKQMKESLTEESVAVRFEKGLSGKYLAYFSFHRNVAEQTRIVTGDELRLKLAAGAEFLHGKPWEGVGYVLSILDNEVCLELRNTHTVPDIHDDYLVEYIWKSTSYDRMQNALKTFAIDDTSVTGYIYHKLLGHVVEEQMIGNAKIPESWHVPGLPQLNESQMAAVQAVLTRPLSLIQGPPGTGTYHPKQKQKNPSNSFRSLTLQSPFSIIYIYIFFAGKTVTSATLVYHLTRQNMGQVLVTAPST